MAHNKNMSLRSTLILETRQYSNATGLFSSVNFPFEFSENAILIGWLASWEKQVEKKHDISLSLSKLSTTK